jgi:large subunit ribosomal protein L11
MSSKQSTNAPSSSAAGPSLLKLTIPTGQAAPGPPVGPALGQKGVKAIDFCRQFNDASTKLFQGDLPLRTLVTVFPDRRFSFEVRPPSTGFMLRRAAGVERLSSRYTVAEMSLKVLYEIARQKHVGDSSLKSLPLRSVFEMVLGAATRCGIKVIR